MKTKQPFTLKKNKAGGFTIFLHKKKFQEVYPGDWDNTILHVDARCYYLNQGYWFAEKEIHAKADKLLNKFGI